MSFVCVLTAVFFSFCPIYTSIAVRDSIKRHRLGIIEDLEVFFGGGPNEKVLSFEFVKFKYKKEFGSDFLTDEWILFSLPLVMLLILTNLVALEVILVLLGLASPDYAFFGTDVFIENNATFSLVVLTSYLGAYLFMLRAFFQAVNNFDLSSLSFLGAFNNIVFGILFGLLTFLITRIAPTKEPIVLLSAFVGGYMPDVILRAVTSNILAKNIKMERGDVLRRAKSIPLEIIDGIDSAIRYRLSDFHLMTVQNLASANPIMLFVETPYGVYQMLDWVAQAQLCAAVGPDKLFLLWNEGIRTIFDLERIALHDNYSNGIMLQRVALIFFGEKADSAATSALIRTFLRNPYTTRLRQIFIRVEEQLGDQARAFPPMVRYDQHTAPIVSRSRQRGSSGPRTSWAYRRKATRNAW